MSVEPQAAKGTRRVFLVMPALDEEAAIGLVLGELPAGWVDACVVADNGSTDSTAKVASAAGAHVVSEPRRGYGRACLTALDSVFARGRVEPCPGAPARDGDLVVFLDADHSDYPEDLPSLLLPLLRGEAELVLGSRVLGGASLRALLPQAWFGNRLACFLLRVLYGAKYTDLGPFRALCAGTLERLAMSGEAFGWTVEMQIKAREQRLQVLEVPVRYRARIGHSKITGTLRGTLGAAYGILAWILGRRLGLTGSR